MKQNIKQIWNDSREKVNYSSLETFRATRTVRLLMVPRDTSLVKNKVTVLNDLESSFKLKFQFKIQVNVVRKEVNEGMVKEGRDVRGWGVGREGKGKEGGRGMTARQEHTMTWQYLQTCSRHCSLHSLSLDTTTRPLLPLHSLYFITFWQNWRNLNSFVKCCPCLDNWQRPSQRLCFRNEILWKCWSHWKMADLLKCVRQLWNLEHFQNTEPWKMRLTCCHVSANFEIQISNTQIIRLKSPYVTMTVQIEMSTW